MKKVYFEKIESLISVPVSAELKVGVPERLEIICSLFFLLGLPQRMSVIMNLRLCNTSSEDIFDESTSRITPLLISRSKNTFWLFFTDLSCIRDLVKLNIATLVWF